MIYGNTITKTRFICVGLMMRLLVAEFDIEGRWVGADFKVKVISLTINFLTATFMMVFLNMLIKRTYINFCLNFAISGIMAAAKMLGDNKYKLFEENEEQKY